MIKFWYTKVKLRYSELSDVPARYYDQVFAQLVADGIYDKDGNRLN